MPTAVRPAANNPGIGAPAADTTAPVDSSTASPPNVSIGHG